MGAFQEVANEENWLRVRDIIVGVGSAGNEMGFVVRGNERFRFGRSV